MQVIRLKVVVPLASQASNNNTTKWFHISAFATCHRLLPSLCPLQQVLRVVKAGAFAIGPVVAESSCPSHSSAFVLLPSHIPPVSSHIAWRRCSVAFPSQASRNQERSQRLRFMGEFAPVMQTASRIYREFVFSAA